MSVNFKMRFYLHLEAVLIVRGGRKYPYLYLGKLCGIQGHGGSLKVSVRVLTIEILKAWDGGGGGGLKYEICLCLAIDI